MNIFEQVRTIASDVFATSPDRLSVDSSPETVESWDSIQHLNLVLALEEKFNLQFSPEEIEQMSSIRQVAKVLEGKVLSTASGV